MTEAPDKIWAGNDGYANRWDWDTPNDWPEYTRSDIAQAKAASLEVYIMQMEDNLYKLEAEVARLEKEQCHCVVSYSDGEADQ